MTFTVVGLGEVLWDLLPSGPQLGGAPANFTYHAAALGARGLPVTRVGDDERGREVLRRFAQMNLPAQTVQVDAACPTGTVAVTLDAKGVAHYSFPDHVAWDRLEAMGSALQAVHGADAICFGTLAQRSAISRQAIQQLLVAAPPAAVRIFDINLRLDFYSREVIYQSMRLSNVLKLNGEELGILTDMFSLHGDVQQKIESLVRTFGFKVVAVTRGAQGSLIFQDGHWSQLPPQPVELVDTVGAGDAFAAALAMGLLTRKSLDELHAIAADLARFVCSQPGATPVLPGEFRRRFQ